MLKFSENIFFQNFLFMKKNNVREYIIGLNGILKIN
jgi:hypothetical protein